MRRSLTTTVLACLAVTGCSSLYYGTMSMFGSEKRDIFVDRVQSARDGQDAASKQFQTTLERFKEVSGFTGGDLEAKYNKLSSEYETAKSRAETVKTRIAKIEDVAEDMFEEWEDELKQFQDPKRRAHSEQTLKDTQSRYAQLLKKMKAPLPKMDDTLRVFGDVVLSMKHDLNAQAIASLSDTSVQIETDVQSLIRDLQASIREADAFIGSMSNTK